MLERNYCDCSQSSVIVYMGDGASYRFKSVGQALAFFSYQNPARSRSINLLEIEHYLSSSNTGEFENDDVWASVCLGIKKVLIDSDIRTQKIFLYYYYQPSARVSPTDIAKHLNISDRRFYQLKRRFLDELEIELAHRGLIEPINKQTL